MKKERIDKLDKKAEELETKFNDIEKKLQSLYTDDIKTFLSDFTAKKQNIEKCDKTSDAINDWYNDAFIDNGDATGIKTDLENANKLAEKFTTELENQKVEMESIKNKFQQNNDNLETKNKELIKKTTEIKQNLEETYKDLKAWRDEAVGGSSYKCFKETANEYTNKEQSHYRASIYAMMGEIVFLMVYAGYLVWQQQFEWHNLIISVPIAIAFGFIWWTAKQKSNQYAKLKEEYRHKATSMESFVGYRKQFKEQLNKAEYDELFKSTIAVNLTRNPSDELDKILLQPDPVNNFSKIINKITDKASDAVSGLSKLKNVFNGIDFKDIIKTEKE